MTGAVRSIATVRRPRGEATATFLSAIGQEDNIGDVVLRRGLIDALRSPANRIHVLVGELGDSYVDGLNLRPWDTVYRSAAEWRRRALASCARGYGAYAFNAGEINNAAGRNHLGIGSAAIGIVAQRIGRGSFVTGVGLRAPDAPFGAAARLALRSFGLVSWRDHPSLAAAGVGEANPDWALVEGPVEPVDGTVRKTSLLVTMRFDRPAPSRDWYAALERVASAASLTPIATAQVRRDNDRNRSIAKALGCEFVEWAGADHRAQEATVRSLMDGSLVVASDRLHALLMGATHAAVPLPATTVREQKLLRTLRTAGTPTLLDADLLLSPLSGDLPPTLTVGELDARAAPQIVARSVRDARVRLDRLAARIQRVGA